MQLGAGNTTDIGDTELPSTVGPVDLGAGRTAVAISAGNLFTCAILDDGAVRCWGAGADGRTGQANTTTVGDDETPGSVAVVDLGAGRTAAAIAAGARYACALLDDATVRCWGANASGQLGYANTTVIGDNESPATAGPVGLGAGRTARAITAGDTHTCAILDNNAVRCWGANADGQLGYANTTVIGDDETPATAGPTSLGGVFFATADLSLTASAAPASITTGGAVTYTITLTNAGPDAAQPAIQVRTGVGQTYQSHSTASGTYDSATGAWTPASVPSGGSATLTLTLTAALAGPLSATAEIVAGPADPDFDARQPHRHRGRPGDRHRDGDQPATAAPTARTERRPLAHRLGGHAERRRRSVVHVPDHADQRGSGGRAARHPGERAHGADASKYRIQTTSQVATTPPLGGRTPTSVPSGTSAVLTLSFVATTATTPGPLSLTAEITEAPADPDSTPGNHVATEDDQATATVSLTAPASLATKLSLAFDLDRGLVGSGKTAIDGELRLKNTGSTAVSDVVVLLRRTGRLVKGSDYRATPPAEYRWVVKALGANKTTVLEISDVFLPSRKDSQVAEYSAEIIAVGSVTVREPQDTREVVRLRALLTHRLDTTKVSVTAPRGSSSWTYTLTARLAKGSDCRGTVEFFVRAWRWKGWDRGGKLLDSETTKPAVSGRRGTACVATYKARVTLERGSKHKVVISADHRLDGQKVGETPPKVLVADKVARA